MKASATSDSRLTYWLSQAAAIALTTTFSVLNSAAIASASTPWTVQQAQAFATDYTAAFQASQGYRPSTQLVKDTLACMQRAYDWQVQQGRSSNEALDYATQQCHRYLRYLGTDFAGDSDRAAD
ncbi:hypothetical protein [Synechococcus elongatus]|uniref:Uncharacterized protein n=2 Tax=Synechococcus elongatus TaxID=32046 RepID=Q31L73_SYNE7|nr:hypothetical protein [Synechococcus elongatus]ABB58196.1 conserved hypothetical protein [Synechococcus elongatus PCC 7942 = FACHB-805]AJD57329.1 hypothetical protein M744_05520 [Synechococcus elongatus UTEX 2973]MBD2586919.1 hypothetical protein [Synechococcus elongatus FACHB-242]MBD2687990.1 hypothetical protein [Synechococcus elongatus FACHB-1061]MBD2706299.1 hypothetical protein [Synechococcus elongatus PCC 7942 = FACHB-805]